MTKLDFLYYISFDKNDVDIDLILDREKKEFEDKSELFNDFLKKGMVDDLFQLNKVKKIPFFLFCNNSIEHHSDIWKQCSEDGNNLIMFDRKYKFGIETDFEVFEKLIEDFDFLHNKDYSIYLMSNKFCSFLKNKNVKEDANLVDFLSSLQHEFKEEVLVLGE